MIIPGRRHPRVAVAQVAIEIIIGFDDSWLQPDMLPKVQDAWRDFLGGLMAPPIRLLAYIPGTSNPLFPPPCPLIDCR